MAPFLRYDEHTCSTVFNRERGDCMQGYLADFFDRIAGALILIAAIGAFTFAYNQMIISCSDTKANYANDEVYSEAALAVTNENVIPRAELTSLIMNCPNRNITVRDDVSGYIINIVCGLDVNNTIRVEHNTSFTGSSTQIVFGINRWDTSKLKLGDWLQASEFTISDVSGVDGSVQSTMYYGQS